jgi:DNA-directed RNA polymerase subunit F
MRDEEPTRRVSIAEAKNILKKLSKERAELSYGQRIALEHAEKFARLPLKKTTELIKELQNLEFLEEAHAYKIADILPLTEDDVKAIFAKERFTPGGEEIKTILTIVNKYYIV